MASPALRRETRGGEGAFVREGRVWRFPNPKPCQGTGHDLALSRTCTGGFVHAPMPDGCACVLTADLALECSSTPSAARERREACSRPSARLRPTFPSAAGQRPLPRAGPRRPVRGRGRPRDAAVERRRLDERGEAGLPRASRRQPPEGRAAAGLRPAQAHGSGRRATTVAVDLGRARPAPAPTRGQPPAGRLPALRPLLAPATAAIPPSWRRPPAGTELPIRTKSPESVPFPPAWRPRASYPQDAGGRPCRVPPWDTPPHRR
jgi:hypothetical protein